MKSRYKEILRKVLDVLIEEGIVEEGPGPNVKPIDKNTPLYEAILKIYYKHPDSRELVKNAHIEMLESCDDNATLMMQELGVNRDTFYRHLHKYGIR